MQPQATARMEHPDICALSGVVAMGAIVIGGAWYLTSVGNPSAIEDAKHTIYSAISGLLLAITSWVIVREINPDISVLKNPAMPWKAVGYSPGASTPQCAYPGGPAGPESTTPCSCKDGTDVQSKNPLPPVVIATAPTPCAKNISTAAPAGAIVITYSEKMDKASVENSNAVLISGSTAFVNGKETRILDATGTILTITPDPALALTANVGHWVQVIGGNPSYNKSASTGTPMASTYAFNFYTGGVIGTCTPPPTFGSFCDRVCGNPDLANDGLYHCGSKFLVVKLNTTLATPDHNGTFVYIDPSISEMWKFFLTNDGNIDEFNVSASSYTDGGITYDCAILITDENTGLPGVPVPDTDKVIWVKAGAIIKDSGNSLENDIGSDYYNDTCPGNVAPFGLGACELDVDITGYDISNVSDDFANQRGAIKIFKTKYNFIQDECEKNEYCLYAKSRAEYKPRTSIVCDPDLKAWVAR